MEDRTRGRDRGSGSLFSYVDLEERVPRDHPLRVIGGIVNDVLATLSPAFEALYSPTGRPSIPPEKLLRALLLQAFYSIRPERQLMEQLDFNLLFRWFVGLGIDHVVWDASTFCHNRDRFLEAEVSADFLNGVVQHKKVRRLLSRDHFSVDGTLIDAWASMKSFRPRDGGDDEGPGAGRNGERDFHGETRSNATHESTTDAESRLYRKTKIDGRTTRHPGYEVSQRCRKRIEEIFGWVKTSAGLSKTKFRGRRRVDASFTLALASYNLIRLPKLLAEAPP